MSCASVWTSSQRAIFRRFGGQKPTSLCTSNNCRISELASWICGAFASWLRQASRPSSAWGPQALRLCSGQKIPCGQVFEEEPSVGFKHGPPPTGSVGSFFPPFQARKGLPARFRISSRYASKFGVVSDGNLSEAAPTDTRLDSLRGSHVYGHYRAPGYS